MDIFRKILLSAAKCAVTGGDPEAEAKKCAEDILNQLQAEMDTDVTISYRHKKGNNGSEVHIEGCGTSIIIGLYNLLGTAALQITSNKENAMEVIEEIYEGAKKYVNNRWEAEIDGR